MYAIRQRVNTLTLLPTEINALISVVSIFYEVPRLDLNEMVFQYPDRIIYVSPKTAHGYYDIFGLICDDDHDESFITGRRQCTHALHNYLANNISWYSQRINCQLP